MKIGVSLRSGYAPMDARTGARWMVERARAAADAGLDSLFVGDHHNVPVPYYQNVADPRPPARGVGRTSGRRAVPACRCGIPCCSPSRSARSRRSRKDRSSCSARSAAATSSSACSTRRCATRPSRFEAALDIVRRLCARRRGEHRRRPWTIDRARIAPVPPEPLEVWIGGARRAGRRSRRPSRRRVPHRSRSDTRRGARARGALPRGVRAPRPRARPDRRAPRRARRRRRGRRAAGRRADHRARLPRLRPDGAVVGGVGRVADAFADLGASAAAPT